MAQVENGETKSQNLSGNSKTSPSISASVESASSVVDKKSVSITSSSQFSDQMIKDL